MEEEDVRSIGGTRIKNVYSRKRGEAWNEIFARNENEVIELPRRGLVLSYNRKFVQLFLSKDIPNSNIFLA